MYWPFSGSVITRMSLRPEKSQIFQCLGYYIVRGAVVVASSVGATAVVPDGLRLRF